MKICANCGAQLADQVRFCDKCGAAQAEAVAAPQPQYQEPQYQQYQQPQYQQYQQYQNYSVSDWDGGVLDTIVNSIVASLIITFTCGIATPWAVCYMVRFVADHAIIDGKRIQFTGTGGGLFAQWIKWLLLTVITCGIYSFWVVPRMYKWIISHLHTVG